jgi:hypothetical protein
MEGVVNADAGKRTRVALLDDARAGNGYLLYTRLLTLFFEMTLNCFPKKLGPIKQHLKNNRNTNNS